MKYEQKVQVETSEYICLVKRIDGVVAQKTLEQELIRCKDCVHFEYFEDQFAQMTHCDVHDKCPDYTDYCSWAERREE